MFILKKWLRIVKMSIELYCGAFYICDDAELSVCKQHVSGDIVVYHLQNTHKQ